MWVRNCSIKTDFASLKFAPLRRSLFEFSLLFDSARLTHRLAGVKKGQASAANRPCRQTPEPDSAAARVTLSALRCKNGESTESTFLEGKMPATPHIEKHFTASESVRDVVIGMADGLTVPFALAAGISGAIAATAGAASLVVTAGFAEIAAGSIAMGLGGYLAAKTDAEHYSSEREREIRETVELRDHEIEEVAHVL